MATKGKTRGPKEGKYTTKAENEKKDYLSKRKRVEKMVGSKKPLSK